jgi:hypothetical protein
VIPTLQRVLRIVLVARSVRVAADWVDLQLTPVVNPSVEGTGEVA